METALFYVLLGTGLRESEVVSLNVGQYRQKGLCEVLHHKSKSEDHMKYKPKLAHQIL